MTLADIKEYVIFFMKKCLPDKKLDLLRSNGV